jgi:iron(III) transport system ATP-binding protein
MMFQNLALWPHLRAEGQLRLVLHAWPKAERWKRVEEMLAMVKLSDKGKRFPHELSGGEQQRLALARALAPAPKVLLLDEPLSNLDPELRLEIRMELKRIIRSTGTTTLMVTHLPEDAEAMAARIARMEKGRIV